MRESIRRQFTVIFVSLMAGTILLCWFVNNTFLERYYIRNKQDVLLSVYGNLQQAVSKDMLDSDSFDLMMQRNCEKYNLSMLVVDANSRTVKISGNDSDFMRNQLLQHVFRGSGEESEIMEETERYTVWRVADQQTGMEYIEIWGILNNQDFFLIRTALEGIQDSVRIANRFLAYVGIAAAIASGIIIWLVSRRITRPILQLTDISQRMSHLDFTARYEGKTRNEISLLGENINKLSDTLEKTISELKTANNELTRDIQKKTKIDEMRREFLANVSHELKTPIALIQGYAEGLQEGMGEDPESRQYYCDVIVDEAARMNEMVKKLLTLNQLEFGSEPVTMERFDIMALLENYLQSARILLEQNGIRLSFRPGPPLYVWGDEFMAEEVFTNYFTNAVHYCRKEKRIVITVGRQDGHARICVFNTGEPIPEEALPHLWEKFYKVDKARTREYGGSGVGLSIVKAVMEAMNQKYGVSNREDGVVFWFELELAEET